MFLHSLTHGVSSVTIFQAVGLELRGLLTSVDEFSKDLPQNHQREVTI